VPRPLPAVFFRTETGREPVREWLQDLPKAERKIILHGFIKKTRKTPNDDRALTLQRKNAYIKSSKK
jgi:hypothetical protein